MTKFLLVAFAAGIDLFQAFITFTIGLIPVIGFPIAIVINVAISATLGLMLCLTLWQAGYLRRGLAIPGFFTEAIPVLSSLPFWTGMTVASLYLKRRKRVLAGALSQATQDQREKGGGKVGSFGRRLLGTTAQGRKLRQKEEARKKEAGEGAGGDEKPDRSSSAPLARSVDGISGPRSASDPAQPATRESRGESGRRPASGAV